MKRLVQAYGIYALAMLPLLALFIPGMAGFPYPPDGVFSDLTVTHFPYALAVRRALLAGEYPWSATHLFTRAPLSANPLANLWYPPHWPALLLPLPFGLNLVALLHLLFGAAGMAVYLRSRGLSRGAALVGLLAYSLLPRVLAMWGAGFLSLLYAWSWLPWLLASAHSAAPRWFRSPAFILAMIFLADPRFVAYAVLLYLPYRALFQPGGLRAWGGALARDGLLALGWSAPLLLPFGWFTVHSTRAALQPADAHIFALTPLQSLGVAFPFAGVNHELQGYVGLAILGLALAATVTLRTRAVAFWAAAALLSALLALGPNLPGGACLAQLPVVSLLRVPGRMLLLTSLALVMLAVEGVQAFIVAQPANAARPRLALLGVAGFSALLAAGLRVLGADAWQPVGWSAAVALSLWGLCELRWRGQLTANFALAALCLLLVADLGVVARGLFRYRPRVDVLAEGAAIAQFLAAQPGEFAVYSPSYSLPQHTAAWYGLTRADGVDPLQLASYAAFMQRASGVPQQGYSVTLPSLDLDPGDTIDTVNRAHTPDIALLGQLNVRYVVSAFPLAIDAPVVFEHDGTRIYHLPAVDTRVSFALPHAHAITFAGVGLWVVTTALFIASRRQEGETHVRSTL